MIVVWPPAAGAHRGANAIFSHGGGHATAGNGTCGGQHTAHSASPQIVWGPNTKSSIFTCTPPGEGWSFVVTLAGRANNRSAAISTGVAKLAKQTFSLLIKFPFWTW